MQTCIFCKIVKGEIPSKKEYEDEEVMVIENIKPEMPMHLLIIPKEHIEKFADLSDLSIWTKMSQVAKDLIDKHGLVQKGYRLLNNGGRAALVGHLHLHLMGDLGPED